MRLLDAAATVLAQTGAGLHVNELTDRVIAHGLWTTEGKTPRATVEAALATDIKAHGEASRFKRVAPRTYCLSEAQERRGDEDLTVTPTPGDDTSSAEGHSTTPSLTFLDAAERVLKDDAKRAPMHYRAITDRAISRGLIATAGRTPEATMYAQIITDIDRFQKRGERSRFIRHGRGLVGLSAWETDGLTGQIEKHNQEVRRKLAAHVLGIAPAEFEQLVGRLLGATGFNSIQVTKISGDGGIDVRGTLVVGDTVRIQMAVQAKRWKANVRSPVIQQVRGSLAQL